MKLFLRNEPTTNYATVELCRIAGRTPTRKDVQAYADRDATQPIVRWPWDYSNKPDRRYKRVMINCASHEVEWLPDLESENSRR